jgi:general stress protein 26
MKIINASSEIPGMNSIEEAEIALGNKLNLQLATIDKTGYPNIQPVWFVYDTEKEKLYILTSNRAKKTLNVRNNSKVYFSVDDSNVPYQGVKGRGIATILENQAMVTQIAEKISLKYYGDLNHPGAKALVDRSKQKDAVVIEINPKFFSTWDFGKV